MTHPRRAAPDPSLVGRDEERAAMLEALDAVTGSVTWLVTEGEPGIGKTRLLADLTKVAVRRGFRVIAGRGPNSRATFPSGSRSTPSTTISIRSAPTG